MTDGLTIGYDVPGQNTGKLPRLGQAEMRSL